MNKENLGGFMKRLTLLPLLFLSLTSCANAVEVKTPEDWAIAAVNEEFAFDSDYEMISHNITQLRFEEAIIEANGYELIGDGVGTWKTDGVDYYCSVYRHSIIYDGGLRYYEMLYLSEVVWKNKLTGFVEDDLVSVDVYDLYYSY